METEQNVQELLQKLENQSRQQLLFTKILCGLCAVVMVLSLVLTLSITGAVNQLVGLVEPLEQITGQVKEMTGQAGIVMDNMETVTQTLADADLGTMVEQVNTLAANSQTAVSEAMAKLDTIDIATLNKAIQDLADVVEPLAKVSNIFR